MVLVSVSDGSVSAPANCCQCCCCRLQLGVRVCEQWSVLSLLVCLGGHCADRYSGRQSLYRLLQLLDGIPAGMTIIIKILIKYNPPPYCAGSPQCGCAVGVAVDWFVAVVGAVVGSLLGWFARRFVGWFGWRLATSTASPTWISAHNKSKTVKRAQHFRRKDNETNENQTNKRTNANAKRMKIQTNANVKKIEICVCQCRA